MRNYNDLIKLATEARQFLNDEIWLVTCDDIPVFLNNRLSRAFARTLLTRNGLNLEPQAIDVQEKFFFSENVTDKDILETLIHEYLHTLFPNDGHTGNWKYWADYITNHSEYTIGRTKEVENFNGRNTIYKYGVYCPKCGKFLGFYTRKSKVVSNSSHYIHKECGTALQAKSINFTESDVRYCLALNDKKKVHSEKPEQMSLF